MESSKYNRDNFERFLREKTDEFRMYPSKRVWYSIYNDMHPGNRLPSLSMSVVLICALFLIGYLNTNSSRQHTISIAENTIAADLPANTNHIASPVSKTGTGQPFFQQERNLSINIPARPADRRSIAAATPGMVNTAIPQQQTIPFIANGITNKPVENNNIAAGINNTASLVAGDIMPTTPGNDLANRPAEEYPLAISGEEIKEANTTSPVTTESEEHTVKATVQTQEAINVAVTITSEDSITDKVPAQTTAGDANTKEGITGYLEDRQWIEDFALHNKPVAKKWAGKLGWAAYFTPSVVYRQLRNNAPGKVVTGNSTYNNTDIDKVVKHFPSFGVEAGLALQYDIKKLRLKAGIQANYTRYNAHAFEIHHPVGTSLLMNDDNNGAVYESFRSTPYTNMSGLTPVKLRNETWQLSLPVGADIRLGSISDRIAWYAGATVQPTYIIAANSFVLSTDRRNYINDHSLLNRFNLNAGFETYLSLKTDNYTWQLGPQFRSQIFSTNTSLYTVEERLMNFGFKLAISKKF